ncbi:O-antigen ligase family protein [Rhizomicrobium electricum]|uniref:O-antigen ligase-related domain-containing protein n=1 Tax=Rhizomicrobium electricum TaxID=480070 RepID=A0ABN1EM78_9PROT|nr:O-antigen ligase family protein [Rhizomicrobium electricum]NIJ46970.1 hypothetical protein [Rhizomicrobium electricum]
MSIQKTQDLTKIDVLRRVALVSAMLLSGGWFLFPRIPLILILLGICIVLIKARNKIHRGIIPVLALISVVLFVQTIWPNQSGISQFAIRLANFLGAALLLNVYLCEGRDTLSKDLYPILKWMAIQSVVTCVLANTMNPLFVTIDFFGPNTRSFLLVLIYHFRSYALDSDDGFIRPSGFFWEPGIFQIYLNVYFYLALFVFKSWRQSSLGLLAVLSTWSTTGAMICVALICIKFAWVFGTMRRSKVILAVVVGIVLTPVLGAYMYRNAADKFSGADAGSYVARLTDLKAGVDIFTDHPLFGIGFAPTDYARALKKAGYPVYFVDQEKTMLRTTTNGVVMLLVCTGILLSIPFVVGLFTSRLFPHPKIVGGLLFVALLSEPIFFTPFPMLVIFGGFSHLAEELRCSLQRMRPRVAIPSSADGM